MPIRALPSLALLAGAVSAGLQLGRFAHWRPVFSNETDVAIALSLAGAYVVLAAAALLRHGREALIVLAPAPFALLVPAFAALFVGACLFIDCR
jgi:hypothetical protein